MPFPTSFSFTRDIAPDITFQNIDEVMDVIEFESLKYGDLNFKRLDNKLIINRRLVFLRAGREGYLFDAVDYAIIQIDVDLHTVTYQFHIVKTGLFMLLGLITPLVLPFFYDDFILPDNPMLFIGVIASVVCITILRLERYTIKITEKVNEAFERVEEVEEA